MTDPDADPGPGMVEVRGADVPTEIAGIDEYVDGMLDYLVKEPGSMNSISLVVRDDDGEIVSESTGFVSPGVYALTRVTNGVPPNPERFIADRDGPPGWVEWEYREPPLDHMPARAVCTECGESSFADKKTLDRQRPWIWDRIHHRPVCRHASEEDAEFWQAKDLADEIGDRREPRRMAITCLWREAEELRELERDPEHDWGVVNEATRQRGRAIWEELERRLDASYPACRECGAESLNWIDEGALECFSCSSAPNRETSERYRREARRIAGVSGHGGGHGGK